MNPEDMDCGHNKNGDQKPRERTPPGCHFRRSKKGALYGEEHTKGRRLKVPGPEQCDGIGSKMLSA